jgi:hypothetical protein
MPICLYKTRKMRKNKLVFVAIIFVSINIRLFGLTPENDSVLIKRCQDFDITGEGRNVAWENAGWINLTQAGAHNPAYATRVKVMYSVSGIYFLYSCGDRKLTSTMKADNLNLWEEDVVEAFLWTDEGFPVYFEYELSPYNFELPIMVPNNKGTFLGWLPWHYDGERKTRHATSVIRNEMNDITEWTAEFFIPFKLLAPLSNVPPVPGTKWRANMYRIDYDSGSEASFAWKKVSHTFHEFNKFGTFIFE